MMYVCMCTRMHAGIHVCVFVCMFAYALLCMQMPKFSSTHTENIKSWLKIGKIKHKITSNTPLAELMLINQVMV